MEIKLDGVISQLKQNNIYFREINFKRTAEVPNKIFADFDVDYAYPKKNQVVVELKAEIRSDNGLNICASLIGEYELLNFEEIPQNTAKELMEKNTVAIMFPYLRAELCIISAQPNMPTLNMPAININALLENIQKNKKTQNK